MPITYENSASVFEGGQPWADELATLLVEAHDKVIAAKAASRSSSRRARFVPLPAATTS
jgi:hypothetical protein